MVPGLGLGLGLELGLGWLVQELATVLERVQEQVLKVDRQHMMGHGSRNHTRTRCLQCRQGTVQHCTRCTLDFEIGKQNRHTERPRDTLLHRSLRQLPASL